MVFKYRAKESGVKLVKSVGQLGLVDLLPPQVKNFGIILEKTSHIMHIIPIRR